ncbi:hypothetical protein QVD17_01485 [Tagetes erecta]|uniref:Uncharacterized protein n=1 Tax=Tagetes erecta TaxID=13708 RepID=A0AAD8L7A7_TARER|nr:hypothetical protein QVD17_01485 [Tagetes erecta]
MKPQMHRPSVVADWSAATGVVRGQVVSATYGHRVTCTDRSDLATMSIGLSESGAKRGDKRLDDDQKI